MNKLTAKSFVKVFAEYLSRLTGGGTEIRVQFDKSQLMRGTVEGCILKIISEKTTYGYEIIELLKKAGFKDISEGTIYPLLLRLERQGSISSELRPSPLGPKRKYYSITDGGREYLRSFETTAREIMTAVFGLLGEDDGEGDSNEKKQ